MITDGAHTCVHGLQAELLMTVHHKNLVSFVGYCDDDNKMALIYEYMANGSLKDFLLLSGTPTLPQVAPYLAF